MTTVISTTHYSNCPGWREEVYLTKDGDYGLATFKYHSIKVDLPLFLEPGGEPDDYII